MGKIDSHGFDILEDGIGNRFRLGDRVKYVGNEHPEIRFRVFKAWNFAERYDRRARVRVREIQLGENGKWVSVKSVFAQPK